MRCLRPLNLRCAPARCAVRCGLETLLRSKSAQALDGCGALRENSATVELHCAYPCAVAGVMTGRVSARNCCYHQPCEIFSWAVLYEDIPTQVSGEPACAFFVVAQLGAAVFPAVTGAIAARKGVEVLQLL
jgi:hypothetical protein